MGALDGITILELADYQTAGGDVLLAEMGAEVIKVEEPEFGDTLRGLITIHGTEADVGSGLNIPFETSNRSKKSITLNLKTNEGKQIFTQLIEKVDIFYTNYREEVLKRLGADYQSLRKINSKLVYGFLSTFGSKGPWAGRRGYDFQAQAVSGLMSTMGDRDSDEPTLAYGSICDQSTGMMLACGLLAALVARDRQGISQKVEVSMYGTMAYLQSTGINITSGHNRQFARHSRTRVREPMTNYYKCSDGKWILFCEMRGDEYWPLLANALGLNEIANDPNYATVKGRRKNYQTVIETLDRVIGQKTLAYWLKRFEEVGLDLDGFAYSPVHEYMDVLQDPQAIENQYIINRDYPTVGKIKLYGNPIDFSATASQIKHEAPEHGQHTEIILNELLGLDWERITELRDNGII